MIEILLAQSLEVDDIELTLRDILNQLNPSGSLRKNSLGILHCNHAFIESGAVQAICERLPFPVVGLNTILNSSSLGFLDNMLLSIIVLTSDEVKFATGLSGPLDIDLRSSFINMYLETENLLSSRPAFALLFAPISSIYPIGERIVQIIDEVSDGVPLFGAQPSDYTTYIRDPQIIYNGATYRDRAAIVLVEGKIKPRFNVFPLSPLKGIHQKAIITAAEDNIIMEVNGIPVLEFLESLGLCWYGQISGTHTIAIFLDKNDGNSPIIRIIQSQTPEGHIVLSGNAPIQTTLGLGAWSISDSLDVITRVGHQVRLLVPDVILLYSCLSRNITLGLDYMAEMEAVHNQLKPLVQYSFAYTGGEICPVYRKDGKIHNEYHNMALITLSL
ncbi:MAG: hypothetical protein LBF22_14550 [Deltaproteobacteria bacterium]|jgi:hypothetical protein|nr:hypothetical protein [Deltaproteobacteria bacterium]